MANRRRSPMANRNRRELIWRPCLETLESRETPSANALVSFPGLSYSQSGTFPPDTDVAAGPTYVVETVNSAIRISNKFTGAAVSIQQESSFFSPLGNVLNLSDSVVIYDELLGRFAIGVLDFSDAATVSRFDFAVSNTSDPTGSWSYQRYDMYDGYGTWDLADFPRIGWNADAYAVTFNMYPQHQNFDHVDALIINKTSIGTAFLYVVPSQVTGGQNFTLTPAVMHGSSAGDPLWLVQEAGFANGHTLQVVEMTNVLSGSPGFFSGNFSVPAYGVPSPGALFTATQPGTGLIDANDTRILNVELRGFRLVATQIVGASGGAVHARFYEFCIQSPEYLAQEVEIDRGAGVNTYYPSVAIAANGDLGMTFMESSSSEYMSMYVTGRSVADPLNTLQPPVLVAAGAATYSTSAEGAGPYRAGDFSGITVDPTTGTTFWAANEYATSAGVNNWGTKIANFWLKPQRPAEILDAHGQPNTYVVGQDGNLYSLVFSNGQLGWQNYGHPNGDLLTGNPTAVLSVAGYPSVYVRGQTGNMFSFVWNGTQLVWVYDANPGVLLSSDPAEILDAGGQPNVYVVGRDSNLYSLVWNGTQLGWQSYGHPNGDVLAGDPAVVRALSGYPSLFVRGQTGNMFSFVWNGTQLIWVYDANPGVLLNGDPAEVLSVIGQPSVYVLGRDRNMYSLVWNGTQLIWVGNGNPGTPLGPDRNSPGTKAQPPSSGASDPLPCWQWIQCGLTYTLQISPFSSSASKGLSAEEFVYYMSGK